MASVAELAVKIDALSSEITKLRAESTQLRAESTQLRAESTEQRAQIEALGGKVSYLGRAKSLLDHLENAALGHGSVQPTTRGILLEDICSKDPEHRQCIMDAVNKCSGWEQLTYEDFITQAVNATVDRHGEFALLQLQNAF